MGVPERVWPLLGSLPGRPQIRVPAPPSPTRLRCYLSLAPLFWHYSLLRRVSPILLVMHDGRRVLTCACRARDIPVCLPVPTSSPHVRCGFVLHLYFSACGTGSSSSFSQAPPMGALPHPDSSYSIPPLRARAHPAMPVHSHPCESSAGTPFFKPRLTETRAWPGEENRGGQGVVRS